MPDNVHTIQFNDQEVSMSKKLKIPLMARLFGKRHIERIPEICRWIQVIEYKGIRYIKSEGFMRVETI